MNKKSRRNKNKSSELNNGFNNGKLIDGIYYVEIGIGTDGKIERVPVQVLVATAFVPNPNNYIGVRNIDGNLENNRADNLEWVDIELPVDYVERFKYLPVHLRTVVVIGSED